MVRSVRQRRKQKQDRLGVALIALVVLTVVGGTIGFVYLKQTRVVLDEVTLCPQQGPRALTVVLVDATDRLEAVQQLALRQHLEEIKDSVERYGALQIYAVGPIGEKAPVPLKSSVPRVPASVA